MVLKEERSTPRTRRIPITVGITGHIDLHPADVDRAQRSVKQLFEILGERYPDTPICLLSSLAEGADRIAAKAFLGYCDELKAKDSVIANSCELIVPLPFPQSLYEGDFPRSTSEFQHLTSRAAEVFSMPIRHGQSLVEISCSGSARNAQYQDASRYIAGHSDILVAMWDGLDIGKVGGTSDAIRVRLLDDDRVTRGNLAPLLRPNANPVFHISVARISSASGEPATDIMAHPFYCSSVEAVLSSVAELSEINDFNRAAISSVSEELFSQQAQLAFENAALAERVVQNMSWPQQKCFELFITADALAVYFERRWRGMTYAIYGLGLVTALLLAVAADGVLLPWSLLGYFLVLAIAALSYTYVRVAKIENRHIESRALAEILRVQFSWFFSSIEDPAHRREKSLAEDAELVIPVTRVLMGQQQGDLGWLIRPLTTLSLHQSSSMNKITLADRDAVVNDWISGQSKYFKKSSRRMEETARRFGRCSFAFVALGLLATLGAVSMTLLHVESVVGLNLELIHHILVILSAALPICAVVIENASERFGLEAQARIRLRMNEVYERSHELVCKPHLRQEARERIIQQIGREAVSEATMWLFLRKIKPVKISV
jgi:hypothetical protein